MAPFTSARQLSAPAASLTRTASVMDVIRSRIASRSVAPGERLPSIRRLAESLGVSPGTVVEAYDRLAAEGLIRAQRGSGFFVAAQSLPPLQLASPAPARRAVDPFWVSRMALEADETVPKPGCGWLPPEWMPEAALRRALRQASRAETGLLTDYANPRGSLRLRRLLLARCAEEGLPIGPEHLLLAGSGTEALDLVCRLKLAPGDTVLIDDPCYFNFQALLKAHQVRLVSVPYTASGPDMAAFEAVLAAEKPKLYITNSALHNPTGATLSPATAHRLLVAAAAADLTIIEDDIFADLEPEPSVRLAALDGLQRVIRIGSFSKTLSASVRCGYIAAQPQWIEALTDLQIATRFGGPSAVATELIAEVLSGGTYRKHVEDLRRKLARSRRDATRALARLGIEPVLTPRGGFYLWCRLPEGMSSTTLAERAAQSPSPLILAPGNVFSLTASATNLLRFNTPHTVMPGVIERLKEVMG